MHDSSDCECRACEYFRYPALNEDGTLSLKHTWDAFTELCNSGPPHALAVFAVAMAQNPNNPSAVLTFVKQTQERMTALRGKTLEEWT